MTYSEFYRISDYANVAWKGNFTPREIAENAFYLFRDFEWSKANGIVAHSISTLLENLDEDVANGEKLADVNYWRSEIRKELKLNNTIM